MSSAGHCRNHPIQSYYSFPFSVLSSLLRMLPSLLFGSSSFSTLLVLSVQPWTSFLCPSYYSIVLTVSVSSSLPFFLWYWYKISLLYSLFILFIYVCEYISYHTLFHPHCCEFWMLIPHSTLWTSVLFQLGKTGI